MCHTEPSLTKCWNLILACPVSPVSLLTVCLHIMDPTALAEALAAAKDQRSRLQDIGTQQGFQAQTKAPQRDYVQHTHGQMLHLLHIISLRV